MPICSTCKTPTDLLELHSNGECPDCYAKTYEKLSPQEQTPDFTTNIIKV